MLTLLKQVVLSFTALDQDFIEHVDGTTTRCRVPGM
jgi:hypothetical protein